MSVHVIYYQDGAKMMRPVLSREEYLALRGSSKQQAILKAVREGDERQKHRLLQMNYSCLPNEDGTLKGSTRMSTSVGMDIDHIKPEEMQPLRERILQKKEELGLLMLEMSARKQGYHLVFKRRSELSQKDNLKWASELLEVEYDAGAKDITRVFFTTTADEENLLYLSDEIFDVAESQSNTDMTDDTDKKSNTGNPCSEYSSSFKGIPYTSIIAEYWRRTGGEPTEGERNKRLHRLAANLRAICDDSEVWLLEVMPRYGLSVQEMKSIIHSACKEPTKGSRLMDQIVAALASPDPSEGGENDDDDAAEANSSLFTFNSSLKRLPQGIRDSIDAVGPQLAMPVVVAICPCIGALATGVMLDVHGRKKGLNLISYIAGDFASGKGDIDPVVDAWMSEVQALDKMYQMLKNWRKQGLVVQTEDGRYRKK